MHVRVTEVVLDEGLVMAVPGDVGEVLDSGDLAEKDGGGRWVVVKFSNAPRATTCILGEEVAPMLSAVPSACDSASPAGVQQHEPAPPAPVQAPRRRARHALVATLGAVAASLLAVLVWKSCMSGQGPNVPTLAGSMRAAPTAAPTVADVGLTDVASMRGGRPLAIGGNSVPATPEPIQKRPPCDRAWGEVAIRGACYVVVGNTRPPCSPLYEWEGQCVRPVLRGARPDTSVGRE